MNRLQPAYHPRLKGIVALVSALAVVACLLMAGTAHTQVANESDDLEVRYAELHVKLAELDLERALAWNEEFPGLFSERTIDYLRKHVEIDREQLELISNGTRPQPHELYIRTAEAALEVAEKDVARREEIYEQFQTRHHSLDLKRARVFEEAARLHLRRAVDQIDSVDTIGYLQWQLEEQRNQILELHVKVEATSRR